MKNNLLKMFTTTALIASATMMAACNGSKEFNPNRSVSVISREQGSGTRDAFVELTGVLVKQAGKKKDMTTADALVIDGTQAVMSNVAGNEYAVGYISFGSLNNSVKAVEIEGVPVSVAAVREGSYKIARPFNVAFKETQNILLNDFLSFIASKQGAAIIEKNGYVSVFQNAKDYESQGYVGKLVIAGSSSVSPIMEKLKEAYMELNKDVLIEIQTNDSSSGMLAAKEGTCDLGMASRALKESESNVLKSTTIAMDGIAVIVNKKNPVKNLKLAQVKSIFTGEVKSWEAFLE